MPPHSAHFTLPSPNATNCPPLINPACYLDPVAWPDLPLYSEDYVGLRQLNERGAVVLGECRGVHMQVDEECWENIASWLGDGQGVRKAQTAHRLVIQL